VAGPTSVGPATCLLTLVVITTPRLVLMTSADSLKFRETSHCAKLSLQVVSYVPDMGRKSGLRRILHSRVPYPLRDVLTTVRAHRIATLACAGLLCVSAFGVTAYARHARLDARLAAEETTAAPTAASGAETATPDQPARGAASKSEKSQAAVSARPSPTAAETTSASASASASTSSSMTISDPLAGAPFSGVSQVGTLFGTTSDGSLTSHHCTGSVVSSPQGDIVITAAHCVYSGSGADTSLAFVPEYDDGAMPYGAWYVSKVVVPKQWIADRDPDDDYAFIVVHKSGSSTPIQAVVGADTLAVDQPYSAVTRVIGYPSDTNKPITCTNRTSEFSATQLEFDCADYPGGTSGSPFLVNVDSSTGRGEVVGVIGGYETGGDSPDVSYSVHFDDGVTALLAQAETEG
jgi:V8-like Glu-specific endopeptidase